MLAGNAIASSLTVGIPLLVGVLAIPVIIRTLGQERFGLLSLVWIIVTASQTFDLGITRAVVQRTATVIADEGLRSDSAILPTASVLQLILGAASGLGVNVVGRLVIDGEYLGLGGITAEAHALLLPISALIPIVLATGAFYGSLAGQQRFRTIAFIRIPTNAAFFVVPAVGGLLDWSLGSIGWGLLATRVLALAAYLRVIDHPHDAVPMGAGFDWNEARRLLSFGAWVTVSSVLSPVLVYLDRFVIAALLGMASVGIYTVPQEIVLRSLVLPSALAAPLLPYLSAHWSGSKTSDAVQYISAGMIAAITPILVLAIMVSESVTTLMIGETQPDATLVLGILVLSWLPNAVAQLVLTDLYASGKPKEVGVLHIVELPIYVAIVILLTAEFGIVGAGIAWSFRVIGDLFLLLWRWSRQRGFDTKATMSLPMSRSAGLGFLTLLLAFIAKQMATSGPNLAVVAAAGGWLYWRIWVQFGRLGGLGRLRSAVARGRPPQGRLP